MLIRSHDAGLSDEEWQAFVSAHDFGQLVASGSDRQVPVIVPTHFVFNAPDNVLLHLAKDNPIWPALEENPMAVMSVVGAYTYVPTQVNGSASEPPEYQVPTSFYGAVQLIGSCRTTDDTELAAILNVQLAHFQPDGGYATVGTGDNPYGRQLKGIRGLHMDVHEVRSKFKFGNHKTEEHQLRIADWLSEQDNEETDEAREHLMRRLNAATTAKELAR